VYCYLIYPRIIITAGKKFGNPTKKSLHYTPAVSIIIAVYNEEHTLNSCIESVLSMNYPQERIEIIIGSDGSTDNTNTILETVQHQHANIKTVLFPKQRGKMLTLNDLVPYAAGELLFFIDGDVRVEAEALRLHTQHFVDPAVGATAGRYMLESHRNDSHYLEESSYVSLEQRIREAESQIHSTVGLYGGNYMIRRHLWTPLPNSFVHDDMFINLHVISAGYRVIYERNAITVDTYDRTYMNEFHRKARSASRGFMTVSLFPDFLRLTGNVIPYFLWSHKILRWLSPVFLLLSFLCIVFQNILLGVTSHTYAAWAAIIGVICLYFGIRHITLLRENPILYKIYWLLSMNTAYFVGLVQFVFNKEPAIWQQSKRSPISSV
jgi:cellulose synthase/poly-beta-1,6-N-acetylglucosamine synthase-like glycosyltransferase